MLIEREKAAAGVDHANDEVKLQKIRVDLAKDDLDRATKEYAGGVISQEAFNHVEKTYQMMQAHSNRSIRWQMSKRPHSKRSKPRSNILR